MTLSGGFWHRPIGPARSTRAQSALMRAPTPPSPEVQAFAFRLWSYKQGELVSLMVHIGHRLGLYRALAGTGSVTADEFAARVGLDARWITEWLRGQAAADLIDSADGITFVLSEAGKEVLVDEGASLAYSAAAFGPPLDPRVVDAIVEAFRTGRGPSYDERGVEAAHQTAAMSAPWARQALVPLIVPSLAGVEEKLRAGAVVADLGCGAGTALLALAEEFPHCSFNGYDPSAHALALAREAAAEAGASNVTFHQADAGGLPTEPTFDFALVFDVLHDMCDPAGALEALRLSMKDDGALLVKEIRCRPDFADNRNNPMLAMLYGFSITGCLASATSCPGGAGLGTVGLHGELLEEIATAAGFSSVRVHDFGDPANLYYEVRP